MREQREGAKFAAPFEMGENFAGDALLVFKREIVCKLRAVLDERFLRVGGLAVDEAHKADQLVPRFTMAVAVLPRVNCGEFPLLSSGKRLDGLRQVGRKSFKLLRGAFGGPGLPEVGADLQLLQAQTGLLAQRSLEVFRARKIMELRKLAGKLALVLARERNVGAVKVRQLARRKRNGSYRGDGAGDPAESLLFLRDFAGRVGGRPGFPCDYNVAILVGAGVHEL